MYSKYIVRHEKGHGRTGVDVKIDGPTNVAPEMLKE